MTERKDGVDELIIKSLQQRLTPAEQEELTAWIEASPNNRILFDWFSKQEHLSNRLAELNSYDASDDMERTWQRIKEAYPFTESAPVIPMHKPNVWKRIAIAASIVGVLFVGYWLMNDKTTDDGPQTTVVQTTDVSAPDKNRAQINLADGRVVYLDSAANGELVDVNGVKLVKMEDGKIAYNGDVVSGELKYNTLYNPRGSKVIDMQLADGSRVWLNAGSSVTYPIAFNGKERKVSMTGEGYFEVNGQRSTVDGKKVPFIVEANGTVTEVLGTHFNVNAYDDESDIKVTLLEGKVKVSTVNGPSTNAQGRSTVIKPGQQAVAAADGGLSTMDQVDVEQVMAWKNGKFSFNATSITAIMKQVSRWYDVEVVYAAPVNETFYGELPRTSNLADLVKFLEATKLVRFEIKNKTITVFPK